MDITYLIHDIYKRGSQEDFVTLLADMMPKMSSDMRQHLCNELEKIAYQFTPEEARLTVKKMTPYGEHYSLDQIKEHCEKAKHSIRDAVEYYMATNMAYNDYHKTAEKFGHKEDMDFYLSLAKDFIDDADGVPMKTEKYFRLS